MSAILNTIIGELVDVGKIMNKLSTDSRPFDVQFEDNGEQYVLIVRKLNIVGGANEDNDSDGDTE